MRTVPAVLLLGLRCSLTGLDPNFLIGAGKIIPISFHSILSALAWSVVEWGGRARGRERWWSRHPSPLWFVIGGYSSAGKSWLVQFLMFSCPPFPVCPTPSSPGVMAGYVVKLQWFPSLYSCWKGLLWSRERSILGQDRIVGPGCVRSTRGEVFRSTSFRRPEFCSVSTVCRCPFVNMLNTLCFMSDEKSTLISYYSQCRMVQPYALNVLPFPP